MGNDLTPCFLDITSCVKIGIMIESLPFKNGGLVVRKNIYSLQINIDT